MRELITGMIPARLVLLRGPGIVLASLAAVSANSLPGIPQWPGTHWIPTVATHWSRRDLRGAMSDSNPKSALQSDWLSVMISGLEEGMQLKKLKMLI